MCFLFPNGSLNLQGSTNWRDQIWSPKNFQKKKNAFKYSIDRLDYVEHKLISLFLLLHFWHTDINEKTIRFHFSYLKLKKEKKNFSKLRVPQGFKIGWDHFVDFISDLFLLISDAKIQNTLHDNWLYLGNKDLLEALEN